MSSLFTIIFGPTATGKSAQAYKMALEQKANILSFDSRQLYQGMKIVTGQDNPPLDFPAKIFGYNLVKPNQEFSIRHFYEYAAPIISEHRQKKKPLILVGGSWPYANVLLDPPETLFIPVNYDLRHQLEHQPVLQLQTKLKNLDHQKWQSMNRSDRHNPRRLIRAIEVSLSGTTQPALPLINTDKYDLLLHTLSLKQITKNIAQRITTRLQTGALEETKQLIADYPNWNTPAFSATGYQYLREYLEDKISLETAKKLWLKQERDYAKRQLTWLRSLS